jgi:hypothetical protein
MVVVVDARLDLSIADEDDETEFVLRLWVRTTKET